MVQNAFPCVSHLTNKQARDPIWGMNLGRFQAVHSGLLFLVLDDSSSRFILLNPIKVDMKEI